VLAEGNTTGANDISIDEGQRIFVPDYEIKGITQSVEIKMGTQFILKKTNKSATTTQGETGQIEISTGSINLSVNAKDQTTGNIEINTDINGDAYISTTGVYFNIIDPTGVKFIVELPTGTASLANGQWWNDNGTVKIYSV
jgi:hypothetical protein